MEVLGVALGTVGLFVAFGLLVGVLFGFFGMGGSFLVTPALLAFGYPTRVAVGSGLAFVFGTSVVGALRHRTLGQVDYRLAALLTVSVTAGIELGKRAIVSLEAVGLADAVVSVAYVLLLGSVGAFVVYDSSTGDGDRRRTTPLLAAIDLPPHVSLVGGTTVPVVGVLAVGLVVGVLSGFLGVGGGFLLVPAMLYGLGVPAAVAVGTDVLQITVSGAVGSYLYALDGGVDLSVVVPLLLGSALGARVGTAATAVVEGEDITVYFGAMLLLGAAAVALRLVGETTGHASLGTASLLVILAAAVLVAGAVVVAAVRALREGHPTGGSAH